MTLRRANLLVPAGKVYFTLFPVKVTSTLWGSVVQVPTSVHEVFTPKSRCQGCTRPEKVHHMLLDQVGFALPSRAPPEIRNPSPGLEIY